ncbi:hypothetical protein RHMOL_Rhmol11G0185600 [Rhododendron molle]|uniref:Uncharacterized protein n=1 Tax=Rhododendron molle TaxID=49168 RepID=A0ACC0LUY0_RHOML|nr:hypothetical protein RHMOL_Rhmol11G0185600 [Rhododendron molle]
MFVRQLWKDGHRDSLLRGIVFGGVWWSFIRGRPLDEYYEYLGLGTSLKCFNVARFKERESTSCLGDLRGVNGVKAAQRFCSSYFLSSSVMYMIRDMRIQFGTLLADIGLINLPKNYQVFFLCSGLTLPP